MRFVKSLDRINYILDLIVVQLRLHGKHEYSPEHPLRPGQLKVKPERAEPLLQLGEAAIRQEDWSKGIDYLQRAVGLHQRPAQRRTEVSDH